NPIEVNIRRFILKILATGEATEWSLLKNNQELCYGDNNQIDWKITTKESIIICLKQKQIRGQGEDFIRKVIQNILGVTAKSEKFQKFQQLALEVKVETFLTAKLQKDFKISLTEAQILMANILIRFILAFKKLIWKPRCEQVILWEKRRGISRTDKITSESKGKDNSNQPSEYKVKDNTNKLLNKVKDIQTGKIDRLQRSVSLVKKSMDTFVRKYICEDWIPIKKKVDKVTLYTVSYTHLDVYKRQNLGQSIFGDYKDIKNFLY
ncbi:hypothetical protein GLOIN_2v1791494, partial [Rhizophagus irregularis DAOM 181602=DAOM 197198]